MTDRIAELEATIERQAGEIEALHEAIGVAAQKSIDRISQLESALSSARRNERRYLWLREQAFKSQGDLVIELLDAYDKHTGVNLNEGVDRACDAAMGDGK
jgi:cob(I)alamin adenosyltransferase